MVNVISQEHMKKSMSQFPTFGMTREKLSSTILINDLNTEWM